MNYIGISAGFHDASLAIIDSNGDILFAGHSERYSKQKHDSTLSNELINDAISYCNSEWQVHYYEKPILKYLRQLRTGEFPDFGRINVKNIIGKSILEKLDVSKIHTHSHHMSHAAAGFQTSPYDRATVVIIDSIGEFDTISIWGAEYVNGRATYKKLWKQSYPDSIGLFYSAMTKRLGLRPLDEEYILMGMAGWGKPSAAAMIENEVISDLYDLRLRQNFHAGVDDSFLSEVSEVDIASSTQVVAEKMIHSVMQRAKNCGWSNNLVYMGGVALNCLANRNLGKHFDHIWIMPNPGDAGSSLGAAALGHGGKINWNNAYLGHDINGDYPVNDLVKHLMEDKIAGVANGRAEFGPRALGNRSLLADPRGATIKDRVNDIKKRQRFRPFAPVILEEYAGAYFDMPVGWSDSRYMQIVAKCKFPIEFPAIIHIDGTSRVQTVPSDGSGIRKLLEEWHKQTGCPMLLNTSLNIRGEPMVNDRDDANRFEQRYGIRVCS
jgi:carbamoyltransferase